MAVSTVIVRELRAEARNPVNYLLRVVTGLLCGAVLFFAFSASQANSAIIGRNIFFGVNHVLFFVLWICAPLFTADCLSREKRDGTLGLLFLTPLKAREIVFGKSIIHATRASTLLLAAGPVLTVPLLIGGVSWTDVLFAAQIQIAALIAALAAGLGASALTKSFLRAVVFAELASAAALALFVFVLANTSFGRSSSPLITGLLAGIGIPLRFPRSIAPLLDGALLLMVSSLAALGIVRHAARHVEAFWSEQPISSKELHTHISQRLRQLGPWVFLAGLAVLLFTAVNSPRGLGPFYSRSGSFHALQAILLLFSWLLLPAVTATRRFRPPSAPARSRIRWLRIVTILFAGAGAIIVGCDFLLALWNGVSAHILWISIMQWVALAAAVLLTGISSGRLACAWKSEYAVALAAGPVFSSGLLFCLCIFQGMLLRAVSPDFIFQNSYWSQGFFHLDEWFASGMRTLLGGWVRPVGSFLSFQRFHAALALLNFFPLFLALLLRFVALPWLERRWAREKPLDDSDSAAALRATFLRPVVGATRFKNRMNRLLDINPVLWLHQRVWTVRLSFWLWTFIATVASSMFVPVHYAFNNRWMETQLAVAAVVFSATAFAAANSFARERETGALELLLVTPLTIGGIVWGRLRGLWWQFRGAIAAMLGITLWMLSAGRSSGFEATLLLAAILMAGFASVAAWGLFLSLRVHNFILRWALTVAITIGIPWVAAALFTHRLRPDFTRLLIMEIALALAGAYLLHRTLQRREFNFQQ